MTCWRKDMKTQMSYFVRGTLRMLDECWVLDTSEYQYRVIYRRIIKTCFGEMYHIGIKKLKQENVNPGGRDENPQTLEEPAYSEKLRILKKFASDTDISIEVFPREDDLVDFINMYHLWMFKKNEFPFDIAKVFEKPTEEDWDSISVNGVETSYKVNVEKTSLNSKRVAYLYLKAQNGRELKWREKQTLKQEIVGDELAVEIVFKDGDELNYTCLICLPFGFEFDFGLR